jgi:hypothetical protein
MGVELVVSLLVSAIGWTVMFGTGTEMGAVKDKPAQGLPNPNEKTAYMRDFSVLYAMLLVLVALFYMVF